MNRKQYLKTLLLGLAAIFMPKRVNGGEFKGDFETFECIKGTRGFSILNFRNADGTKRVLMMEHSGPEELRKMWDVTGGYKRIKHIKLDFHRERCNIMVNGPCIPVSKITIPPCPKITLIIQYA